MCIACCSLVSLPEPSSDALPLGYGLASWIGRLIGALPGNISEALPNNVAGVKIPDTALARDAAMIMRAAAPATLYNHSLRTFVLGKIHAEMELLKIDDELAFVASMLHDIALVPAFAGDFSKTFERNSAEYAETFVRNAGFTPDRVDRVFRAILLHAGQARNQHEADVRFVMEGAVLDVFEPRILSDKQVEDIAAAVPRHAFKTAFLEIIKDHISRTRNPSWTPLIVDPNHQMYQDLKNSRWPE